MKLFKNKKALGFIGWILISLVSVWVVYNFMPEKIPSIKEGLSSAISTGLDSIGNVNVSKIKNITEENELNSTKELVYLTSPYDPTKECQCYC